MNTVGETLRCPYCQQPLKKWIVPQHIWNEWPNDFFYVCFEDDCPYFTRGWEVLSAQGGFGTYRLKYDPLNGSCDAILVLDRAMLRESIAEEN